MDNFGFIGTFNMGYEGFSKPLPLTRMHPIYGQRSEFLILLGFMALVPFLMGGRKQNEDSLRAEVKTNNRYEAMALGHRERLPSAWTL